MENKRKTQDQKQSKWENWNDWSLYKVTVLKGTFVCNFSCSLTFRIILEAETGQNDAGLSCWVFFCEHLFFSSIALFKIHFGRFPTKTYGKLKEFTNLGYIVIQLFNVLYFISLRPNVSSFHHIMHFLECYEFVTMNRWKNKNFNHFISIFRSFFCLPLHSFFVYSFNNFSLPVVQILIIITYKSSQN